MQKDATKSLDDAQHSLYGLEHTGAWIFALLAMGLAILGTLTGLEIIDWRGQADPGVTGNETIGPAFLTADHFWDGAMLLFSGATAGVLALCLHSNDHHRMRRLETLHEDESSAWSIEHTVSYLTGIGAVAYVVIGLLAGFGAFGDHDQGVGLTWIWFGLAGSLVT